MTTPFNEPSNSRCQANSLCMPFPTSLIGNMKRQSIILWWGLLSLLTPFSESKSLLHRRLPDNEMKPRIIGGFDAQVDRYPYAQVSLQYRGSHYCGGSLLAPDIVLTAAHCSDSFDKIQFNRYNLKNTSEHVETLRPVELFWHPLYNESLYHYDILIVKLDSPVSVIEPVRINRLPDVPRNGQELTAVGWGLTEVNEDDSYSDILQGVSVRYIPTDVCKTIRDGAGTVFGEYLTPDMLCAADRGKDSCYGDSGSPLIALGAGPEQDVQVGIVSWGIDCAGVFPGVYSRLSQSFDWIEQTICAQSQDPPIYFRCSSPTPSNSPRPTSASSNPPSLPSPSRRVSDEPSSMPGSQNKEVDIAGQEEASTSSIQGSPNDLLRKSGGFDKPVVMTFLLILLSCVQEVAY